MDQKRLRRKAYKRKWIAANKSMKKKREQNQYDSETATDNDDVNHDSTPNTESQPDVQWNHDWYLISDILCRNPECDKK